MAIFNSIMAIISAGSPELPGLPGRTFYALIDGTNIKGHVKGCPEIWRDNMLHAGPRGVIA